MTSTDARSSGQSIAVPLEVLIDTVERMENRLSGHDDPLVQRLWSLYQRLVPRFDDYSNSCTGE
jgi:hypothetical protein